MTAPMTIRAALAAMLRATAPGEAGLPEAERLAAVRIEARQAYALACAAGERRSLDTIALESMLLATIGNEVHRAYIVPARVAAQAALAEPEPDTAADQAARFVTAAEFREHEVRDPMAGLNAADRDVHRAFLAHELAVAEAVERQPHRRARDVAEGMPFVRAGG